jgi:hypothetical protein
MTDRRDDNPMPRDPRFDAAWASASNEEPPSSLDAAILAAARREVGARPRHAQAPVPAATRPERWWFPLAAAATIGAVALGLLQIVGRDGVFDDGTPAVVSDMPPGATAARREAPARDSATAKAETPTTVAAMPGAPAAARDDAAVRAPGDGSAGPMPQATPSRPSAQKTMPEAARAAVGPAPQTTEPAPAGAVAAPDDPRGMRREPVPTEVAAGAATAPAPEVPVPAAAPPLRFVPSPAPAPAAAGDSMVPSAPTTAARAALATREQAAGVGASAKLAATPAERPRADAARETRQAGTPLPVAEWIALIIRLRDEGRIDDAVKELSAFRRAHADHLKLLPADLAQWRPDAR